ncbi:Alcohol dehydrogenase 1-like protein 1 [Phlyctema vagabunda]|uniref:alcohol dehydrogenase n=1 Tax=Phlyctema vagabunda TaxID=108571 RepID=A0ABR4PSV9_9HELO
MFELIDSLLVSIVRNWNLFHQGKTPTGSAREVAHHQELPSEPPIPRTADKLQCPVDLPTSSLAAQVQIRGMTPVTFAQQAIPQLKPGQLLVQLSHSGVCGTDYATYSGSLGEADGVTGFVAPHIGGHEGIGTVIAMCSPVEDLETLATSSNKRPPEMFQLGQRVGVRWMSQTCEKCTYCRLGRGELCASGRATSVHENGTFQQFCVVHSSCAVRIPSSVSAESAAAMMCAGSTAHTAVKQLASLVPPTSKQKATVAIIGAGGSIGHLAIEFALLFGFEVIAVDKGTEKRDLCLGQGASRYFDAASASPEHIIDSIRELTAAEGYGGVEGVIVAAGGSIAPSNMGLEMLRPLGVLVLLGNPSPETHLSVHLPMALIKSIKIVSTLMSGRQDCEEALGHLATGKIHPRLATRSFFDLDTVLRDVKAGNTLGKIILELPRSEVSMGDSGEGEL